MIARLGADHGDENLLDRRPDRNLRIGAPLELAIKRLALGRIDLGRRVVDDLVDGGVFPAPLIGPRRAFGWPERYHTVVETAGSLRY